MACQIFNKGNCFTKYATLTPVRMGLYGLVINQTNTLINGTQHGHIPLYYLNFNRFSTRLGKTHSILQQTRPQTTTDCQLISLAIWPYKVNLLIQVLWYTLTV